MIIANNSTEGRVEVTFHAERHEDGTITISKQIRTTPHSSTGSKVMWSKTTDSRTELFTVEADLVPSLLAALGYGLTLEPGDWF